MQKIIDIATQVRAWAERVAYLETEQERHDLCGYCAIAAGELFLRLKAAGFEPEIHVSKADMGCHVFVVVDDYVVDVTATQFMFFADTPVVYIHEREAQRFWYYKTGTIFRSVPDLETYQRKLDWPLEQIADSNYYRHHSKSAAKSANTVLTR